MSKTKHSTMISDRDFPIVEDGALSSARPTKSAERAIKPGREDAFSEVESNSFSPYSFELGEAYSQDASATTRIISNAITHRYRAGSDRVWQPLRGLKSQVNANLKDFFMFSISSKSSALLQNRRIP